MLLRFCRWCGLVLRRLVLLQLLSPVAGLLLLLLLNPLLLLEDCLLLLPDLEADVAGLLLLLQLLGLLQLKVLMLLQGMGLEVGVGIRGFACWDGRLLQGGLQVGELSGEELVLGRGAAEAEGGLGERGLLSDPGGMLLLLLLHFLLLQQLLLRHFIGVSGLVRS